MEKEISKENVKPRTNTFQCTSCGGDMFFDPKTQSLGCLYCGNKVDIDNQEGEIEEYDIDSVEENDSSDWGRETRIIHCDDCGAETILKEDSVAQFCAFCGSSHIVEENDIPGIKPSSLIPFKVTRDKAKSLFSKWLKGKFFVPKKVKSNHNMDKLKGVYIPYWTFDSDTYSNYTAQRGTYYYVTKTDVVYRNGKRQVVHKRVRKIRWEHVSGTYRRHFDDFLVNASKHVNSKIINKIEPFDLGELEHYSPEYLSGFTAERYTLGLDEGWEIAKAEFLQEICNGIVNQIGGDRVRDVRAETTYNSILFKHILLPVWMSSYKYKDKIYRFMVNGQTGEVQGEEPVSIPKVILTVLAALGIIVLGYSILMNL